MASSHIQTGSQLYQAYQSSLHQAALVLQLKNTFLNFIVSNCKETNAPMAMHSPQNLLMLSHFLFYVMAALDETFVAQILTQSTEGTT